MVVRGGDRDLRDIISILATGPYMLAIYICLLQNKFWKRSFLGRGLFQKLKSSGTGVFGP
jgi:hypothetical protein